MTRAGGRRVWIWLSLCALLAPCHLACAPGRHSIPASEGRASKLPYEPDRRDYFAFKEGWPDVLEPNYLPFMLHRFGGDTMRGDDLVFCRWPDDVDPLRVYIRPPEIDDDVQDEFSPVDPASFVSAVDAALRQWQTAMDGSLGFERVEDSSRAHLQIRMHGREAPVPVPGKRVLGSTAALARACRAVGTDPNSDRIMTRFDVPAIDLHLADEHGLLPAEMVQRLALHELGHALGMRGHSPSPADLMYARFDQMPPGSGLSTQDVNSFLSLHSLPPGTRYGEVPIEPSAPPMSPGPPAGAPELALAPWVDARQGFEMQLPSGWLRIEEPRGVMATHGPSWDYDASIRVFVWPVATIEDFLERFGGELLANTWFQARRPMMAFGRPAVEFVVEDPTGTYQQRHRLIELPERRVMLLSCEAPVEHAAAWRPWFDDVLRSLEVWSGADRLHEPEASP